MPGISGHADVNGLINWARAFEEKPQKVFVTHGEDTVTEIFAKRCRMTWVTIQWLRLVEQCMILQIMYVSMKLKASRFRSICIAESNKSSESIRETSGTWLQITGSDQEE